MFLRRALTAGLVLAGVVVATGCTIGEETYETVTYAARAKVSTAACDGPFAKVDMDELEKCQDGLGRCWDKKKVGSTEGLADCPGGDKVCVPNEIIAAGGEKKLKECKSLGGKPGRCLSMASPMMAENKGAIPPDVCDADTQRCAPCIHPINGSDTHLCDDKVGVYENECKGTNGKKAAQAESCCHGAGVCMLAESIDESQREQMTRQTCPSKKLCAPASQAEGTPVKCELLGADGVCIDVCFADILRGAGKVMRAGCGPTEVCMPCAVGKSQGMRGCD